MEPFPEFQYSETPGPFLWSVARPAILSPSRGRPGHRSAERALFEDPAQGRLGMGKVPRPAELREQDYGRAVIVNARLLVKW